MQIIESTPFGIRSAVICLRAEENSTQFVLYPMVHVADKNFYEEIALRLESSDVILFEGVRSTTVSLLTTAYRYFANSPRLGLVSQQALQIDHLKDRLVHADVSGQQFEKKWSELRFGLRIFWSSIAPIFGIYMKFFGTRSLIARYMNLNLRKARREILKDEDDEKFDEIVVNYRDRRLLSVIDEQIKTPQSSKRTIAILYGAAHMRAVIRHLIDEYGYRIASAEWITVISI